MRTLRIISDSLGLCRPWKGLHSQDTYPVLLQNHLVKSFTIINNSLRANTILQELNENAQEHFFDAHTTHYFFHLGLVDSAPRLFLGDEIEGIRQLPFFDEIQSFLSENRQQLTQKYARSYVSIDQFKESFSKLFSFLESLDTVEKFLCMNIATPGIGVAESSHDQFLIAKKYNQVLEDICKTYKKAVYIDINSHTERDHSLLLEDYQHFSALGHKKVFELVAPHFECPCHGSQITTPLFHDGKWNSKLAIYYAQCFLFMDGIAKSKRYFTKNQWPEILLLSTLYFDPANSHAWNILETVLNNQLHPWTNTLQHEFQKNPEQIQALILNSPWGNTIQTLLASGFPENFGK